MTDRAEQLLSELLALQLEERGIIALHLNASLDNEEEIDPTFVAELDRRRAEHEVDRRAGTVKPESVGDMMQRIREKVHEANCNPRLKM